MKLFRLSLLIILSVIAQQMQAHHGKDYLNTATCVTPHAGSLCAHLSAQYFGEDHGMEAYQLFSPGIIYGITNDLGVELHSHFTRTAAHSHIEALALETRYSFFAEHSEHHHADESPNPFSLAASVEFEQGMEEHPNILESRLIFGKELGIIALVGNVIVLKEFEEGQHTQIRFAVGMRTNFTQTIGLSVELLNGNHHSNGSQLGLSCSVSPMKKIDLQFGMNITAMNNETNISSLQAMMMYSF